PLELDSLPELDAEAVAVTLLFSFRDPTHEQAVAAELRRRLPDAHVVASHEIAPEFREYERASTTAADAYLGPLVARYLRSGAEPGPACYGRGGARPTVPDANLQHGRRPGRLAGGLELDREAAARALEGLDPAAVIEVVDAEMLRALRVVSVERGHDPRDFALVAFGGAGPLHACALAEELGIEAVLVPEAAGVLSALGLVASDERRDRVVSHVRPL